MLQSMKNPFFVAEFLSRPQPYLTGSIAPSGRFTVGSLPKSPPKRKTFIQEDKQDGDLPVVQPRGSRTVDDEPMQLSLLQPVLRPDSVEHAGKTVAVETIGSSNAGISHRLGKRGSRGISARGSDQLKYWISEMERWHGRRNISFLTLTCPEVDEGDRVNLQTNWSEIVRRFIQELKRSMIRKGARFTHVVGCTEIQPQRSAAYGWSVPHLHLVFRGKLGVNSTWLFSPTEIRGLWQRTLSRYLQRSDVDFRATENIQRIRKSASGYIAKYISKSVSKNPDAVSSSEWHPSDYCIIPKECRRWFRANTVKGNSIARHILDVMKIAGEIDGFYMCPITIKSSIGQQVMGWVGYNPDWRVQSREFIKNVP